MKLTPEQLRQTADAIEAYNNGKAVQYQMRDGSWCDVPKGNPPSSWTFSYDLGYRPKPEPKTRPWSKPEDVPGPVCWIRYSTSAHCLVGAVDRDGIWYSGVPENRQLSWFELQGYKYSIDRKTWHPCTVEATE